MSDIVGRRIRQLRGEFKWTREELAQECAKLGVAITPDVIVNIEMGRPDRKSGERRRDITADELVTLAYVLKTSPAALTLPEPGIRLAITPNVAAEPEQIAEWFAGRQWPSGLPPAPFDRNTAHLRLFHAAWEAWEAYKTADRAARWARESSDEDAAARHAAAAEERVRDLARVVDAVIDAGLESPVLNPGIARMMVARHWVRARPDQLRVVHPEPDQPCIVFLSDLDEE